mgnify:CR=1 FL=1
MAVVLQRENISQLTITGMTISKKIIFALVMLCVSLAAGADDDTKGFISGRVVDRENNTLPGAIVNVDNQAYSALTDNDGNYRIIGVEPGRHIFQVIYIGYNPVEQEIVVKRGENLVYDIILEETKTTELGEVVVKGVYSDQSRAINKQMTNMGVTNVVSADQTGKFPDSNVGDALKRISGINVQYDQGEARFGQIRGTAADLTSVTVNGDRIPSAEGDIRSVQLDLIPTDMVQTIEVNKVVTADRDGDAIGGSINLVTKGAPFKRTIKGYAGSGYNFISRKAQFNIGFTYGDRFFDDKFGLTLSASVQNAPSGSYNTEFQWEKTPENNVYVSDYQIRRYYVTRLRQSYSLSLDYNFSPSASIYFRGIFNNRDDWENRYRTTLKDLTPEGVATVRVQTKGGKDDTRSARLERQQTMDFSLGGKLKLGIFDIDWKGGYARATEKRPNERYIDFQLKKQKFNVDLSNPRQPFASPMEGSTMTLDESFSLKELTEQQEDIREEDWKVSVDFETMLHKASKIKFGAKFVNKTKKKEVDFYEYTPEDKKAFMQDAFSHLTDQYTANYMPSNKYNPGIFVDKNFLGSLNLSDTKQFSAEQVIEELAGNFSARERVIAGYARFDSNLTPTLKLMAGLRVENTSLRYIGRDYDDEKGTVIVTDPATSSYTNFLPSLLLKWDFGQDAVARASYSTTLARPKYSALVPGMNIKGADNEVRIGNPNLKATLSHNLDLSVEKYFRSVGLMGIDVFYKRIEGFIVDEVQYNAEYRGIVWTKLTQPKNGGNANVFGIEASYQRDFGFIHPALSCLGFYGNYTYTLSRVSDFQFTGRENEKGLPLPGSPAHTANLSLSFDKAGFNARLSFNYASSFIDEMGVGKFYDRYYDAVKYLDLNASYTFGRRCKITIYAEANNLLNQPLRYYQGTEERTMQAEYYGVKLNGGVKIAF